MLLGREIALVGRKVVCPKCKGVFPILPDPGRNHSFMGNDTAVEGMLGVGGTHCRNDRGARVAQ